MHSSHSQLVYPPLQRLLPLRLDTQEEHANERREDQSSGRIDWRLRIRIAGIDGNDGRTQPCETVEKTGDAGASAAIGRGDHFGSVGVQHAIHDLLEAGFEAREGELEVRGAGEREQEDEDAGQASADAHGLPTTNVRDVDSVVGYDGARAAADGGEDVVAVRDSGGIWLPTPGVG